ncbi:MAG: hypothetical protein GF384_03375 [Elusimicrobia bacterium]|nr:hypothetical protein [Elusimicrobiota bacterium]MBD3411959.1 hypothetical protein [Elusimicrobiota bacterium]
MKPVIAITLGDPAGIGPEIVEHSLIPSLFRQCKPLIIGPAPCVERLRRRFPFLTVIRSTGKTKKRIKPGKPSPLTGRAALHALCIGITACSEGTAHALVTAPVSKHACRAVDSSFIGHTEYIARMVKSPNPIMMMQANSVRMVMLTRHQAFRRVSTSLTSRMVALTIQQTVDELQGIYHLPIKRSIVAALNPHAGENGLLGKEETKILRPAITHLIKKGYLIDGPLSADVAIQKLFRHAYDLGFGLYHDQVMIPFKVTMPERLVNVTLGLPFVRTSPGHGTGFDIAGTDMVNSSAMREALRVAIDMVKKKQHHEK